MTTPRSLSMSSATTYHVQGKGRNPITLTRKHELFNSFVTTRNGFSNASGRAMAMLMDSQYECSDVDEVHIVLGPKSDLKVRIKSDEDLEDDPRAELFEDIIPHVPGKFGKKGKVMWYHYANRTPGPTIHRGLRQWS